MIRYQQTSDLRRLKNGKLCPYTDGFMLPKNNELWNLKLLQKILFIAFDNPRYTLDHD